MSQAQPDESRPDAAEEAGQDPAGGPAEKSAFAGDRPAHLPPEGEPQGVPDEALDTDELAGGGPAGG